MKKLILTDCDGVTFNWEDAFAKFVNSKGIEYTPDRNYYRMSERLGCDRKVASKLVHEFNDSDVIGELEPLYDATVGIQRLVDHGFRFVAISSFGCGTKQVAARRQNLINHFGDVFEEVHGLPSGSKKTSILQRWEDSALFWVEDHLPNAFDGNALGLNSILIDEPHNRNMNGHPDRPDMFHRITHDGTNVWGQIADKILKHYTE